jgi:hypothetical protein
MKRLLVVLAVAVAALFVVACSSAPQHLEGRYAIVFGGFREMRSDYTSAIREALAERLGTVEIVPDVAAASGYDAVIILQPPQTNLGGSVAEPSVRNAQGDNVSLRAQLPQSADGQSYSPSFPTTTVAYEIVRAGRPNVTGSVSAVFPRPANVTASDPGTHSTEVQSAKTLAAAIAKKLAV